MNPDADPYRPPSTQKPAPAQDHDSKAHFILQRWNQFRIIYNIALAAVGLLAGGSVIFEDIGTVIGTIIYAVLANLCFCAGPAIDLHFAILHGIETSTLRNALFGTGLGLSALLTFFLGVLGNLSLPNLSTLFYGI